MDNQNEEMTPGEMDMKFKNMMFNALSQKNPEVFIDQDGFIVIPNVRRRRKPSSASERDNHGKKS
ncbi:MAG: hypothetical protein J5518_02855 [Lachnospiraceae bacterium]|nr:hypothetical protein [Lachnospiraceae bacterium]